MSFISRYIGFFIITLTWSLWLVGMSVFQYWDYFADYWFMSVTMFFGSFIAGATSEGGGAVAFPIMTLAFKIPPYIARDFSLMIQSVGMTAAALTIFAKGILVEKRAILLGSIGGSLGILVGLYVSQFLPPAITKMVFVSVWLSFACVLYLSNRGETIHRSKSLLQLSRIEALVLVFVGFCGGIMSGLTGSGIDIFMFSVLVLFFKLDEKVATPTSVVMMATNAVIGFLYKLMIVSPGIAPEAWGYWWVCVPIVVVGAPFGAKFIKNRSRLFVVYLLYISIGIQYIAALTIIPQTLTRVLSSVLVTFGGFLIFLTFELLGNRRLNKHRLSRSEP